MHLSRDTYKMLNESISEVSNPILLTEQEIDIIFNILEENYSQEEILSMSEEELYEGLMSQLKGRVAGAFAAARSAPISQFVSKAKQYGQERAERYETEDAKKQHAKELAGSIMSAKGGVRGATEAELHSIVGKLSSGKGPKGPMNKQILARAQSNLQKRAEKTAGKGIGGFVAKVRGFLGNKQAMRDRIEMEKRKSAERSQRVGLDGGKALNQAKRAFEKSKPKSKPKSKSVSNPKTNKNKK